MEITVSQEQGRVPVTVLHIVGDVDSQTYTQFQRNAEEALRAGTRYLLLDMEKIPYMSSAGLRAIHDVFSQLRALTPDVSDEQMRQGISDGSYKSPHLKLYKPNQNVKKVLTTAGFDMYLDIHDNMKKALASF